MEKQNKKIKVNTEKEVEIILKKITDTKKFKAKIKKSFQDLIIYGECKIDNK